MAATLTVFDGASSIGGNKIHVESGGKGAFLDFGTNYKRMSQFYEEYLKPRSVRGVHDYLAMGLVPPLDIYRDDLFPSDLRAKLRRVRVDGLFLTHAHMDHAGCIGLLDTKIPVYASPMTAAILKAHQDSGKAELPHQVAYVTPRQRSKEEKRLLESTDWKKVNHIGRSFFLTSRPTKEFKEFWASVPGGRALSPKELGEAGEESPLPLRAWEVDHSIYGATAYALETDGGWVVYTGDLRMHGARANETKRFVREAAGLDPKVLIIEGTRVGREKAGEESEEDVYRNCLAAVRAEDKLVVADFQPRHFERLDTFLRIARDVGRRLVVTARDAYMLEAVRLVDGVDRMKGLLIFQELKEKKDKWEQKILEKFKNSLVDPRDVTGDPSSYILSFSFWDVKNLLDIGAEGGTYVYSSSEAFTEEVEFDFIRLWEWLRFFKFNVAGFRIESSGDRRYPEFDRGYHASGHASPEELLRIVEETGPEIVIPVHTEHPEFFKKNVRGRKVRLVENGGKIKIS